MPEKSSKQESILRNFLLRSERDALSRLHVTETFMKPKESQQK